MLHLTSLYAKAVRSYMKSTAPALLKSQFSEETVF